jgi:hypothetical protein
MTPSGITVDGNQLSGGGTTIVTNGNSSESGIIAEGDVLYSSNLALIGTIASGGIGANITLTGNRATDLTDDEELYIGVGTNAYPNTTPQIITASHTPSTKHDSVFHKIVIEPSTSKNSDLTDKGDYERREPSQAIESPSNGEFDKAGTVSGTNIHEMFDIIDNQFRDSNNTLRLFLQPSDRRRINQLSTMRSQISDFNEPNFVSLMYLMSRARIRAVLESNNAGDSFTTVKCVGLTESTVNRNVSVRGKGSPDSQIVKEIEPNAPVVTVTLGGPGQGAMDTKPTYDPSPLARLPFSTRRNLAVLGHLATSGSSGGVIVVKPLNNNSPDLASWGTYGFPKVGRVYLQDGASAKYDSKDASQFTFTDASAGEGKFLLGNGTEFTDFTSWLSATDISKGIGGLEDINVSVTLFADRFFDETSLAEDGTTVNDRMFQGMSDVQHDYQLGTQYASTRALVEIPFFANQFFNDPSSGTFPGPDNSFKIHIDATHTSHTYNPSPVGRRPKGVEPADREAMSAFSLNKKQNQYAPSTTITKFDTETLNYYVTVANVNTFPNPRPGNSELVETTTDSDPYQNVGDHVRNYRKIFLSNGEWAYYRQKAGNTLYIPRDNGAENWAFSSGFLTGAVVGAAVSTGGPTLPLQGIIPIGSDAFTPSSDFENRGEYYHDAASVKTQGGNVDYGLRQYVSAVEFKEGPESNPHAPRIVGGRAVGKVNTVAHKNLDGANGAFVNQILITMSDEDMDLFPDLDYEDMSTYSFSSGEFLYEAETIEKSTGNVYKMHYYGRLTKNSISDTIAPNVLVFVYRSASTSMPPWVTELPGEEIKLTRRVRDILGAVDGDDGDGDALKEVNNEIIAKTYKPTDDDTWTITASSLISFNVTITNSNGRLAGSNTLGLNLREGDLLYSEEEEVDDIATKILYIGKVSKIEDYDDGTYTVNLTSFAKNTASAKPLRLSIANAYEEDSDAVLNKSWNYPYAAGGLRSGDTIWANMTINNPYATEGLFSKSRGVFNEAQVWKGFNGGVASLAASRPRESVPLENFLIGDTCLETAINYAQHVNQTVKENYKSLGLTESQAPKVAYVDPYLAEDGHARVLLYDVAHDKEFIAFQDLHMQVQTSAEAVTIGRPRNMVVGEPTDTDLDGVLDSGIAPVDLAEYTATFNGGGPSWITTQIDVANGFPSENKYIRSTQQSKFIESAYSHDLANRLGTDVITPVNGSLPSSLPTSPVTSSSPGIYGKAHGHHVHTGYSIFGAATDYSMGDSVLPRTNDSTVNPFTANSNHSFSRTKRSLTEAFTAALVKLRTDTSLATLRDPSTFFDTPDGTRVIPAFLCLKGVRDTNLDLTGHEESRLQHLKQWTDMDFLRRLTVDCGAVSVKSSVVSIESAAQEIVRQINQAGAPKGQIVVDKDTTGSAHDPAPFWDADKAFSSRDRGTHMGYVRAHIGREVQDNNGNIGFTVVIHSTVPGASGRNFCVWLDNSKGQAIYQPDFLIGHGGRWRDFWALPDEKEGENMHPAPMPLNKHGRPFAPITTLTQYINPEETGEDVISATDFIDSESDESPVIRAISNALGGGQQFNTVNTESFSTIGSSSTIISGLRVGKNAVGRVNFGGLVASGVPGFAPNAGVWGYGKKGSQKFRDRYGGTSSAVSYTNHTDANDLKADKLGNTPIYGMKMTDHRGTHHGIRYIYKSMDSDFANDNTTLPDTISSEVCVFFNDRDVGLGGFTLGKHMRGSGDATGRMEELGTNNSSMTAKSWTGNRWRGVAAPNIAVNCTLSRTTTTLTVTLAAPFSSAGGLAHHDVLGYLGFPVTDGILQVTDSQGGNQGMTFSYTRRTQENKSGTHKFFGIQGSETLGESSDNYLITPVLNWTTLVTDELIAAVTTAAINAERKGINNPEGISFDCTKMYATDGKTFGDWGVSSDAIKIRAYDPTKNIRPLSDFFRASIHRDFGIQASHIEFGEVEKTELASTGWAFGTSRATTDALIEGNQSFACGYIPNTVMQISTKSRGPNSNTATPVLVDSLNNLVDTSDWRRNLKGESFTRHSGDHILPMINNPNAVYDPTGGSSAADWAIGGSDHLTLQHEMWNFLIPAGQEGASSRIPSFGETKTIFMNDKKSVAVESVNGGTSTTKLAWSNPSEDWPATEVADVLAFSHWAKLDITKDFDGLRSLGSVFSEPFVFFRGGKSSADHSVPLFFGGGFSGVTLDINDGTKNDYSSFYTHPYANGPTGTTGIQNANEISTSFALLDGNAMFAFFPGAALCNQHRGSILPPMFNKDNILSPDLTKTGTTINSGHPYSTPYTNNSGTNITVQKPSPLILRFAHPTARYEDHRDGTDSKTTYLIFGPGQAFPFTQEVADGGSAYNTEQPHPGRVIVNGNGWSKVPLATATQRFPNHIESEGILADGTFGTGYFMPEASAYQLVRGRFHWRATYNWEPPQGKPNAAILKQTPSSGRMYGNHFNYRTATSGIDNDILKAHPMRHCPVIGHGVAMAADMVYHMDGGYHPGGHWMDNQITFNPPHPKSDTILQRWGSGSADTVLHPSAYRVAGPITTKVLAYAASEGDLVAADVDMEYIIVDATRCQNGEELSAVLGSAINSFPGAGALKAMGGTHNPSMSNAMRQDRYGWIESTYSAIVNSSTDPDDNHITVTMSGGTQDSLEQIPACGWLRTAASGFAPYYAREVHNDGAWKVKFYLAPNRISGQMKFEDKTTWYDTSGAKDTFPTVNSGSIWIWSKAGVHRFNNDNSPERDHMCQTHFSGLVDAIDRTRPIGAVGWAGERYSYLNSLKVGTEGYAAGLGAWHPMLGFSPYGSASSAMTALGHLPVVAPMTHSPESLPPVDGMGASAANLMTYLGDPYSNSTGFRVNSDSQAAYNIGHQVFVAPYTIHTKPPIYIDTTLPDFMTHPQGVFGRAFLVVSYECESALVAKYDRDVITGLGDWLQVKGAAANSVANPIHYAGTTEWDERFHGQDRFIAPANAGPNVEAMVHITPTVPSFSDYTTNHVLDGSPFNAAYFFHGSAASNTNLENAIPSLHKTGDLILDLDHSVGSFFLEETGVERNVADDFYTGEDFTQLYDDGGGTPSHDDFWVGDVNAFDLYKRAPAKNFSVEHVVWKRMDGGNLSLPAINARGLGAVPFVNRVSGGTAYTMGEKIYGNVRFSFETTNGAMLPVLQAQELSHPQLASKFPKEISNVLDIPNEELQFEEMVVIDDSGQQHILEGGSPLGTIIRGFRKVNDRETKGMAPSLANSGVAPNLKIQLPDPNTIPGNIVIRSGFDRVQAYQNETMGSGGMIHPDLNENYIGSLFDNSVSSPRTGPTYEDHNWEHIDTLTKESTNSGWKESTNSAPLQTSYEQHDRTLYFHVTKMGHSGTERYPTEYTHSGGVVNQSLTVSGFSGTTLTVSGTVDASIYDAGFGTKEVSDNRRFLRLATTTDSVVVSYTAISGVTFTGVIGDVDFTAFLEANPPASTTINITPSYYIPAGSNRFFASRRLRDHAEVSGNSPDMAKTEYATGTYGTIDTNTLAHNIYNKQVLTPMPLPRMGHHFVTPTMPMLPGHWAHPVYQGLFRKHMAENASLRGFADKNILTDSVTATMDKAELTALESGAVVDQFNVHDPELAFSGVNAAPSGPSDIHGGAFTLMFETSIKYDGYGILASTGAAGTVNQQGGHSILLESAANYTLGKHFPDPAEVGAYQIVIQPNTFSTQLVGYHSDVLASTLSLTSQQVNTVIGKKVSHSTLGTVSLTLAQATQADVRGCEIFINEAMLDINPDHGSQFTNIPPLLLYNPFGVEGTESPVFTRRALPYTPGQFRNATPGYTVSTPWWSFLHKVAPDDDSSDNFKHIAHHRPDNYYHIKRSTFGSIGVQLTIAGYPSIYPNIYSHVLQNTSLNPKCIVKSIQSAAGGYRTITVDDASRFPETPQYGEVLEYTDSNGIRRTLDYTRRAGLQLNAINKPDKLQSSTLSGPFWDNLTVETTIRLSQPYDIYSSKNVLTDNNSSIFAKVISQLEKGTRDTTNLHIPDAYLCMWNSNLGRPYTFYSDSSRTYNNPTSDRAVDKKPYNSLPEHFESIHYHDSVYAMSLGPLDLRIKTANPDTKTGASATGAVVEGLTDYLAQGGDSLDSQKIMYSKFWPCGSRGGPLVSRLDLYTEASVSWTIPRKYAANDFYYWEDDDSLLDGSYNMNLSGIKYTAMNSSHADNRYSYGWRVSVRQAYNKPTYGILPGRGKLEDDNSTETGYTTDYVAGPLVQMESTTWSYIGGDASQSSASMSTTYVGVMERQTNFAGMLAADRPEFQVRYSDGRRMTRPFGAPLRTLASNTNQIADWWGDSRFGKAKYSVTEAAQYYLVDWWGNERGEDVRRAPVRGFGIRPAWDCGDVYEYDRTNGRTPHARIFNNGKPIFDVLGVINSSGARTGDPPRLCGTQSLSGSSTVLVDVFAPTHSMRVGDMGNGRGVRYPSQFNEDILTELSEPIHSTGIVLSHNTAEPPAVTGLLRPRNDVLQADEIPRGISARLEIAEDGLLKPDAVVSDRVESVVGSSPHKDAISRSTPRIGVDAENMEGLEKDHIVINTEAHSLHTDRGVGQRTVLHGALVANSQSIGDLDLTSTNFNSNMNNILRFSHTNNVNPLGGSYVLETKSYGAFFDDTGWGLDGVSGAAFTTNPYQNTDFNRNTMMNNQNDQSIQWLLRPVRVLDKQHVEMFRPLSAVGGSTAQPGSNFFRATAGGKYGLFTYNVATPRVATDNFPRSTASDTNGPYVPVFYMSASSSVTPTSQGPKILGTESTGFDKTSITSPVTRMVMSENTLQHYRADAARRRQMEESNELVRRIDFSIKPRFSQSLHPKGHKGDVTFNVSNHSGDAS